MKKKLLTFGLTTVLIVSALTGCGNVTESEEANETQTEQATQTDQLGSGTVTLTVWPRFEGHFMVRIWAE